MYVHIKQHNRTLDLQQPTDFLCAIYTKWHPSLLP
jgi:hypothetical protein